MIGDGVVRGSFAVKLQTLSKKRAFVNNYSRFHLFAESR
jgi:hypothetical protein